MKKPELTEYRELLMALFQTDYPGSKYLEGLNSILARYEDLRAGKPLKDLEMQDIS